MPFNGQIMGKGFLEFCFRGESLVELTVHDKVLSFRGKPGKVLPGCFHSRLSGKMPMGAPLVHP